MFVMLPIVIEPVVGLYAETAPSKLFAGVPASATYTEFPTMYASPDSTVMGPTDPLFGLIVTVLVVAVKYRSPGAPVTPVGPVSPVAPVGPVGPSMPSKFTL